MGMADCTRVCNADAFQRRLHGQGVHHGRQHAHIVGGGALHALGGGGQTAEDVSAANHQAQLITGLDRFADFAGDAVCSCHVDAVGLIAHQGFTGNLQKNPFIGALRRNKRSVLGVGHGKLRMIAVFRWSPART
jgi:hypothetical protein